MDGKISKLKIYLHFVVLVVFGQSMIHRYMQISIILYGIHLIIGVFLETKDIQLLKKLNQMMVIMHWLNLRSVGKFIV